MSEHKGRNRSLSSIAIAALLALASTAYSQIEKTLKFIPDKVDFGMIKEENGKVTMKVKAVNISQDSTYIISARTSCGCSAAEYSQDVIAPGDTADVLISYDPVNRPGKFLKTVRFFTGMERVGNSIKLSGTVIPSKENLDKVYPDKAGSLRLSTIMLNAGEVSRKEARPLFVGLYNDGGRLLPLSASTDSPALEAALTPDTIEPFGISTVTLMLKGRNIPDNDDEIFMKAFLIDTESGDTVVAIPVLGFVKS
ncbi:MAG: DUF1573 domain-containing protein [Muribaculaceae bacterium]|nr:DUF1573 domain-containing protein [Muribaculaceae bacterium]